LLGKAGALITGGVMGSVSMLHVIQLLSLRSGASVF
jgi:hypothetical protein